MNIKLSTKKYISAIQIIVAYNKKQKENKTILKQMNFKAKDEEVLFLPEAKILYIGCETKDHDSTRTAVATAIKYISKTTFDTIEISANTDIKAIVQGAILGGYEFVRYKSKKEEKKKKTLYIYTKSITKKQQDELDEALLLSQNINKVRDMINTPPEDFTPKTFKQTAQKLAKKNRLSCKVFDEQFLKQNSMGCMLAVGRASRHQSRLIHLTYKPQNAKKKIVLVGKGLTYDCGGLSLKPSDFMETMKSDKSGGCTVLGIIDTISSMKLPIEIHSIVGAVENMIGGDAYKPDDVLKAKNGTTVEVKNTDAEGRLVLADCLCYAQDEIKDFDYIIDLATLTGACVVGVGEYTTAVMGNDDMLKYKMVQNALESGELATSLPFNKYLKKTLKSELADISNISNTRYGGAITAGLFLDKFIDEKNKAKWLHLDIAGPAFVQKPWGCNPFGASGAGIAMVVEFIKGIANTK